MKALLVLPPMLCCRILVSLLSLYGMCALDFCSSAEIQLLRELRLLFILLNSLILSFETLANRCTLIFSDPAKSTRLILDLIPREVTGSDNSMCAWKMVWDLLECSFKSVAATDRALAPVHRISKTSSALSTSTNVRPATNMSPLSSLMSRVCLEVGATLKLGPTTDVFTLTGLTDDGSLPLSRSTSRSLCISK